jgi:outer membrane protein OmpA-like peptidoglycan-associated protein
VRRLPLIAFIVFVAACGASQSSSNSGTAPGGADESSEGGSEFQLNRSDTARDAQGERPSQIRATRTEAAMRLFVVDREAGPIEGIVIKMTAPNGTEYFTQETDSRGYTEVLVPAGQRYEVEYLSLGRRNTTASVQVPSGPNQNIRLTLRYRRLDAQRGQPGRVVLEGVQFDTGRATLRSESNPRLERVVEYMTHRPSVRIRVGGHTDNAGDRRTNQRLSERRAQAVREYLMSRGIDGNRIEAVGYGDQQPVAPNDTEEGRQQNRRIEAIEL